jgi:hypothetical protein
MGAQASTPQQPQQQQQQQQQQPQQNVAATAGTILSLPFLSSSFACLVGTLILLILLVNLL